MIFIIEKKSVVFFGEFKWVFFKFVMSGCLDRVRGICEWFCVRNGEEGFK